MEKRDLYLALGTNLGDRERNVREALCLLDEAFGCHYTRMSPIVETVAVGFDGPPFLNCIAVYECSASPEEVLSVCKRIEREMGRTDAPEYDACGKRVYHDRIIDIDILLYGDLELNTPSLTIPHPQVEDRAYIKELLLTL